jgi:hypothetical protein
MTNSALTTSGEWPQFSEGDPFAGDTEDQPAEYEEDRDEPALDSRQVKAHSSMSRSKESDADLPVGYAFYTMMVCRSSPQRSQAIRVR